MCNLDNSNNMKIAHITDCLRGGGIQNLLLSLLPEQVKQGHEVTLIVIEQYDYDYCRHLDCMLADCGVKVLCLNKIKHNKLSMLRTISICRKKVGKIQPDIVNTHGTMSHIYGAIAVLGKRILQVTTIHNAPEVWPQICKLFCSAKPHIFCSVSAFDMRQQNSGRMTIIENGISSAIVKNTDKANLKKELSLKPSDKVIVLVGSLRPQKNYEFLKSIVDETKDPSLHFCICGGNYGKGYIPASVFEGYEKNIHLLGLRSDVSAIENCADLFLSCALFEGLPMAVLEAYFNGIPCVLSPIPQHQKISDVEYVWIPKEFTPTAFVASIYEALKCNLSHEQIYESRKKQIAKYEIARTCEKYVAFYKEILASSPSPKKS